MLLHRPILQTEVNVWNPDPMFAEKLQEAAGLAQSLASAMAAAAWGRRGRNARCALARSFTLGASVRSATASGSKSPEPAAGESLRRVGPPVRPY